LLCVEVGSIEKESSLVKDMFTDADTLCIQFPESAPPNHKLIIIGAAVLLDYMFFES
jgi:uncharacterized protein YxjI